jgi:hypothetical protein
VSTEQEQGAEGQHCRFPLDAIWPVKSIDEMHELILRIEKVSCTGTVTHLKLALVQINAKARDALCKLVEGKAAVGVAVQMLKYVDEVLNTA